VVLNKLASNGSEHIISELNAFHGENDVFIPRTESTSIYLRYPYEIIDLIIRQKITKIKTRQFNDKITQANE
jgi:hypothetical protein